VTFFFITADKTLNHGLGSGEHNCKAHLAYFDNLSNQSAYKHSSFWSAGVDGLLLASCMALILHKQDNKGEIIHKSI
jgi:hypothetical protein